MMVTRSAGFSLLSGKSCENMLLQLHCLAVEVPFVTVNQGLPVFLTRGRWDELQKHCVSMCCITQWPAIKSESY